MLTAEVVKRFDGFLLDVAFTAAEGITVLFGPSGAGKSLTLQAIAGIFTPEDGHIVVDGKPLFDSARHLHVPPQRRRIGYVPQNYALFPHLTVADNIAFGLAGLGRSQRRHQVAEMVTVMGLQGLEGRRPSQLSGGQQQRVALARALAFRPRLLLLDEPFSSLDDSIRYTLHQELLAVPQRWQTATLLVTHDLAEAYTLGNHIVVIDRGRVLQQGDREEVFYRPRSRRVAELVGIRNILRATVAGSEADTLCLRWQGHLIHASPQHLPAGGEVDFCIRATQVMILRRDRASSAPAENQLEGHIVREAIYGENYILYLRIEGSSLPHDLEVELPGYVYHRLSLDTDKKVAIALRRNAIHVIPQDQ